MKNTLNFFCEFISEAMSINKLIFLLILIPSLVFSQEIEALKNIKSLDQMSDKDLIEYWDQAQKRGYSLGQIKILARAQGASESDILEFENRIKKIKPNEKTENSDLNETQNEISSIFGLNIKENKDDQDEEKVSVFTDLGIFGSSFFNNPNQIKKKILEIGVDKIDYVKIMNIQTLKKPKTNIEKFKVFVAYFLGKVRLIDNI